MRKTFFAVALMIGAAFIGGCSTASAQCPGGNCGLGFYSPWVGAWYYSTPCSGGKCNTAKRPAAEPTAPKEPADEKPELAPAEVKPFCERVIELVNAHRAAAGLAPLTTDNTLCIGCDNHSAYMARYGFGHAYGIGGRECIAMGAASPDAVVRMWLNSSGHRAILLGPGRIIGVGCFGSFWTLRVR